MSDHIGDWKTKAEEASVAAKHFEGEYFKMFAEVQKLNKGMARLQRRIKGMKEPYQAKVNSPIPPTCGADSPEGYICTLNKGHKGRHEAQGYSNNICHSWFSIDTSPGNEQSPSESVSNVINSEQCGSGCMDQRDKLGI